MSHVNLPQILRDIASGRKNSVGDPWDLSWCNDAADELDKLYNMQDTLKNALKPLLDGDKE